jgi:tetratricopeptide (TPR) repeat protein
MRSLVLVALVAAAAEPESPAALRARAGAAYEQKDYALCADLYDRARAGESAADAYNAACCLALAGRKGEAFARLHGAIDAGFRKVDVLKKDPDLAGLHDDPRWPAAVAAAEDALAAYLKTLNRELYDIVQEDQRDREGGPNRTYPADLVARDARRLARTREIVESGGLEASMDYFHAALIYQHSLALEDYRKAHELCLKAIDLDPTNKDAKWLAAASKDRELMTLGRPQLYGTQMTQRDGKWVVYTVDPTVTDEERARWNVPPLAELQRRAERMNAARP